MLFEINGSKTISWQLIKTKKVASNFFIHNVLGEQIRKSPRAWEQAALTTWGNNILDKIEPMA